jgi:hypothetical protein
MTDDDTMDVLTGFSECDIPGGSAPPLSRQAEKDPVQLAAS